MPRTTKPLPLSASSQAWPVWGPGDPPSRPQGAPEVQAGGAQVAAPLARADMRVPPANVLVGGQPRSGVRAGGGLSRMCTCVRTRVWVCLLPEVARVRMLRRNSGSAQRRGQKSSWVRSCGAAQPQRWGLGAGRSLAASQAPWHPSTPSPGAPDSDSPLNLECPKCQPGRLLPHPSG